MQGASEETARYRDCLEESQNCGFGFVMYTCIRVFRILIYVLYKSENIVTLVTIWYIVGFIVSMYYEYRLWAQVAVLLM